MKPTDGSTAAAASPARSTPLRIVRIIARLNIGGPAIQAITLTRLLQPHGYRTRLVRGREGAEEGNMDHLARALRVKPTLVPSLRRDPGLGDFAALCALIRILRRDRPQIVHTHAAKGGALGRLAALLAFGPGRRPILVHTYHGHSLSGYFSPRVASLYRRIERWLAPRTDALVAVSDEVRDDLVRFGVAPAGRFSVVPLGLDLTGFLDDRDRERRRAALRADWQLNADDEVVTLIARLVPIKRVDRFLRIARLLSDRPRTHFVIVGDGELRAELAGSEPARGLADRLLWTGFREDMADVCFASDVVVLTSDNEGTPVSLIEAQAAGLPVVGTDVGGVRSALRDGATGVLVAPNDESGFAAATAKLLDDRDLAARLARAGREHVRRSFNVERLVDDLDRLYRKLLTSVKRPPL
jgi:glycosyltransferase involved in cell wall biosynthesis